MLISLKRKSEHLLYNLKPKISCALQVIEIEVVRINFQTEILTNEIIISLADNLSFCNDVLLGFPTFGNNVAEFCIITTIKSQTILKP